MYNRENGSVLGYDYPLMMSIVLYVANRKFKSEKEWHQKLKFLYYLLLCFENVSNEHSSFEARYLFLDAIVNHLRFPNLHTKFCMELIMYIYSHTAPPDSQHQRQNIYYNYVQEQLMCVFMHRLVTQRPQPFGLLMAFFHIIKIHDKDRERWINAFGHSSIEVDKFSSCV